MRDLEKDFGKDRVLDTPVSEQGCTGVALGASLCGYRPIVIHPRVDFLILAVDQIVNQAAKWSHMLGGKGNRPTVTIRGIVNRGGEQGAQHSQVLHSWFAHIPGLRVVMPATVQDARDLLIASVLTDDPVVYIDDRWLYDEEAVLPPPVDLTLIGIEPNLLREGDHVTLVGASYSVKLCLQAARQLENENINSDVIDLRVISPLNVDKIVQSVSKTRCLVVVDGGWGPCGLAGEIIAAVSERMGPCQYVTSRITLPFAPAPTSKVLEDIYYPKVEDVVSRVKEQFNKLNQ